MIKDMNSKIQTSLSKSPAEWKKKTILTEMKKLTWTKKYLIYLSISI